MHAALKRLIETKERWWEQEAHVFKAVLDFLFSFKMSSKLGKPKYCDYLVFRGQYMQFKMLGFKLCIFFNPMKSTFLKIKI